jgi:hypothetical protein
MPVKLPVSTTTSASETDKVDALCDASHFDRRHDGGGERLHEEASEPPSD